MIPRLHVPMRSPEDVIPHLGKPTHYRVGRSAHCLANSWMALGGGLPELVALTLDTQPALAGASLIEGFVQREVDLGDDKRPSQTDLLALLRIRDRLVVMSVEAKVDEPFGQLVADELVGASAAKRNRIQMLSSMLEISPSVVQSLRYQLIHRTAAAIIEAKRFCSDTAVMMVHSFDPNDCGVEDYCRFADALGRRARKQLVSRGPWLLAA